MALDPETYANTIAEKYGINLRGSGQSITIKYNADLRPGIYGRTTAANPYVIEIGSDALVSEEELANTIAHELNHARDFIRGGIAPESSAYSSGNALSDTLWEEDKCGKIMMIKLWGFWIVLKLKIKDAFQ